MPIHDVWAEFHIDPPLASALNLLLVLAFLGTFVFIAMKYLEEVRAQRAAEDSARRKTARPLHPGPTIVFGVVELAKGQDVAVQVDIVQHGTETRTKNGYSHRWTEILRNVSAHEFYLRREDGSRIRVKPGSDPLLVDAVDKMSWTKRDERTRSVKLEDGEEAYVEGVLHRAHDPEAERESAGYRMAGRQGWSMEAPIGKRLHISTESLGHRHRLRARAHLWSGVWALVLGSIAALSMYTFGLRYFEGRNELAEITRHYHWVSRDSKGNRHHHWQLDYRFLDPLVAGTGTFNEEVDDDDYALVRDGETVWVRLVPGSDSATSLGRGSSMSHWLFLIALVALLTLIGRVSYVLGSRRWYEGKLIDSGNGRLPDPPGVNAR